MKLKSIILGMLLIAGASATTFAGTTAKTGVSNDVVKTKIVNAIDQNVAEKIDLVKTSCTVSTKWKNKDGSTTLVTLTATCDCTQQQACDAAYKAVTYFIP